MDGTQFVVSMLGGGLAGGCINTLFNRLFYWRSLRIRFYPKLSSIFSAYAIRMENPKGRYWVTIVGKIPHANDDNFIRHRSHFLGEMIEFTELKEVRKLRQAMLANTNHNAEEGEELTTDLMPELNALGDCVKTIEKRMRLS